MRWRLDAIRATPPLGGLATGLILLGLGSGAGGRAGAGDEAPGGSKAGLHRVIHRSVASIPVATGPQPATAAEIAGRIDRAAESIRNDGLVVLKQPDVFSQARMTKYRREFEAIMVQEKDKFQVILAGRVARGDQLAFDSQSSLGAALGPKGASVAVPTPPSSTNPPVLPTLDGTSAAPQFVDSTTLGQDANLNLGLEPNTVLDEHKSYLDRLHAIRRVNLGNDIADSAGYGLYLIRLPVSITPGECTVHGHGAETTVTVKPEFPPNFLPATFRNLVINDLVDQLGPPIYEVVRERVDHEREVEALEAQAETLREQGRDLLRTLSGQVTAAVKARRVPAGKALNDLPIGLPTYVKLTLTTRLPPEQLPPAAEPMFASLVDRLADSMVRADLPRGLEPPPPPRVAHEIVTRRVRLLAHEANAVYERWLARPQPRNQADGPFQQDQAALKERQAEIAPWVERVTAAGRFQARGGRGKPLTVEDRRTLEALINVILQDYTLIQPDPQLERFTRLLGDLYSTALPDDVALINQAFDLTEADATASAREGAAVNFQLARINDQIATDLTNLRTLRLPSDRAAKRSYPIAPRELVDFFLASNLDAIARDIQEGRATKTARASDIRSYLRQQLSVAFDVMSRPSPQVDVPLAPLDDQAAMDEILRGIHNRAFAPVEGGEPPLGEIFHRWIGKLPANLEGRPLGALCWAIAVDAALLDEALRDQAAITLQAHGVACPDFAALRFYVTNPDLAAEASAVFNDYVANRWPVITFALDPVADQQNILDNFSLRRDLQLALAFAFSTGQINFNQLTTFRRKIQQDEETIALNRTITSFAHGNETFGWRITPRIQTPPSQGNLAALGSTLLRGGTGPNYALRKSKLEAGQRELTAVVIMPSFLPTIRVESSGNWFRLDDPEHLEVRTKRMLEQGRRVHELKQEVASACDAACYRPADIRHLRTKIDQLDAMLPIQSTVVALPFDNAPAGFDLFTEGTTALVPELLGFEGAESLIPGQDADLLIFGKFISIHETRVVAGGRELKPGGNVGFEILSREVIRVHIPGDAQPSATRDGRPHVEIYLATPNGISNRLFIPYAPAPAPTGGTASAQPAPPAATDPDGTVETTIRAIQKQYPPKRTKPTAPVPGPRPRAGAATKPSRTDDPETTAPAATEPVPTSLAPLPAPAETTARTTPTAPLAGLREPLPIRLPPLPADAPTADPALVRTSGGVVPSGPSRRHTRLGRALERLVTGHHGEVLPTPRP